MTFANADLHSFGGIRRFAVDALTSTAAAHLNKIQELSDGGHGGAGLDILWNTADPVPTGVPNAAALTAFVTNKVTPLTSRHRTVHILINPDHDEALDEDGSGWTNVKSANAAHWSAFFTAVATAIDVPSYQIGNEPSGTWEETAVGGAGFAEMVVMAHPALKAVRPGAVLGVGGLQSGNRWLQADQTPAGRDLMHRAILQGCLDKFDYLALNFNHRYDAIKPTVAWYQSEMAANGVVRPIWVKNMASGPGLQAPWTYTAENDLRVDLLAGDSAAKLTYTAEQSKYLVKKIAACAAAGVARVFLSTDLNWDTYQGSPEDYYAYNGMIQAADDEPWPTGTRRPAFYAYKQIIAALDGWYTATELLWPTMTDPAPPGTLDGTAAVKFTFRSKGPVVVAWEEGGSSTIDLSAVWPSQSVRVIPIVTTLSVTEAASYPAESTVVSTAVPVGDVPVIVKGLG